jgi:hypothetical protein
MTEILREVFFSFVVFEVQVQNVFGILTDLRCNWMLANRLCQEQHNTSKIERMGDGIVLF